ncbi:MAG: T9SS type A sorting domain-containing protein, partial [Bacteroidota bacterium]
VLPLDLLSFTGEAREKTNLLTWTTANEEDFSHFEVQRSSAEVGTQRPDSSDDWWEIVGEVLSSADESGLAPASADERSYTFEDNPITAYYRLKMVDLDGTFTYSDVVFLENNLGAAAGAMWVYPNPSTGRFTVDLTELALSAGRESELRLVDVHGREVWARPVTTDQLSLLIELSHPRAGAYLLTLLSDDGQAFTRRIVIR